MAPRPAFLSSLGSRPRNIPTGLKPPTQMDRDRENRQLPDTSRPAFLSGLGGGVPTGLTPPSQRGSSSFVSRTPSVDEIFQKNRIIDEGGVSSFPGSVAFGSANPGGMPGVGLAQQFLGNDTFNQAVALGMTPDQINTQLQKALAEGRGVNVEKFQKDLDKFQQFQESDFAKGLSNTLPVIDGKNVFSVSPLQITANPPEGIMGLLGSLFGPFAELGKAGAQFVLEGGATGKILSDLKDQYAKGKGFVGDLFDPGDLTARLDAYGPEAKRVYALKLSQGVPYQQAFEEATGEKFATGGIATLQ